MMLDVRGACLISLYTKGSTQKEFGNPCPRGRTMEELATDNKCYILNDTAMNVMQINQYTI